MEIVLDKSDLDGAPIASVRSLCENFDAILSDELFFELMTAEPHSQKRCFSKLPDRENPVKLVPNVGFLLRFEKEHRRSCAPLTQHRIPDRYVFHKKLREGTFVCEGGVLDNLNAWCMRVDADTKDFIERCKVVHQFFPELNGIEWRSFPAAVADARRKIATEDAFVREIYASFLDEETRFDAPSPDSLTRDWAWFRWIQCQILAALRIYQRHQGQFPEKPTNGFLRRAEHSMLDVYYVVLGTLSGGIATLDAEIRDDFLAVRPDATLVSPGLLRSEA